jgi:DNA-binding transcriptional ArsR family regulator
VLKDAGLVTERRAGAHRYYRARLDRIAELRAYLDGFWGGRLTLLKHAVEKGEGEP